MIPQPSHRVKTSLASARPPVYNETIQRRLNEEVALTVDRSIFVTEFDLERLTKLLDDRKRLDHHERKDLKDLEAELKRASIVASQDVPRDVITMNSRVHLKDLDTGEDDTYTLVFPDDADIDRKRISILAPIGTAMLGYRVGDTFEWPVPDGTRRLVVTGIVYQPEAAGDYHL
jgi:regulator of nucleoside diphosphate kinase